MFDGDAEGDAKIVRADIHWLQHGGERFHGQNTRAQKRTGIAVELQYNQMTAGRLRAPVLRAFTKQASAAF